MIAPVKTALRVLGDFLGVGEGPPAGVNATAWCFCGNNTFFVGFHAAAGALLECRALICTKCRGELVLPALGRVHTLSPGNIRTAEGFYRDPEGTLARARRGPKNWDPST